MKNFDIILVILLVVIISVGIGCIVLYMVNNRLSNIRIPRTLVENANTKESFNGDLNGAKIEMEYEISRLENPDDRDIVEYENNVCQVDNIVAQQDDVPILKNDTEPLKAPDWPNETCRKNIEKKIIEKDSKVNIKIDQVCGKPKEIGQMENYYKIHRAYPSELVNGKLKGYNISNFSTVANIMDIGKINLNGSGEYAQPQNFVF